MNKMYLYYEMMDNCWTKDVEDESLIFEARDEYMSECKLDNIQFVEELKKNITCYNVEDDGTLTRVYPTDDLVEDNVYAFEISEVYKHIGYCEFDVEAKIIKTIKDRVLAKNPMEAEARLKEELKKEVQYMDDEIQCMADF